MVDKSGLVASNNVIEAKENWQRGTQNYTLGKRAGNYSEELTHKLIYWVGAAESYWWMTSEARQAGRWGERNHEHETRVQLQETKKSKRRNEIKLAKPSKLQLSRVSCDIFILKKFYLTIIHKSQANNKFIWSKLSRCKVTKTNIN